jgi:hypothetical protein
VPEDTFSLFWGAGVAFVRTVASPSYGEIIALSEFVATQDHSQVGWTLYRVPILTGGDWEKVAERDLPKAKADYSGGKHEGWALKREALAGWLMEELKNGRWIGKAPLVSNDWSGPGRETTT